MGTTQIQSCDLSMPLPLGMIDLVSYQYQCNYTFQIKGYDPQPAYQNGERLLSCSKQYGVSILTKVYFSLD